MALRVPRRFTDLDRDEYVSSAFEEIAVAFHEAVDGLTDGVSGRFRRAGADRFTTAVYRDGKLVAQCAVFVGGLGMRGISYSNDVTGTNSFNEHLRVETVSDELRLVPLMGAGRPATPLTPHEAATLFWRTLVAPVERA